MSLLLDRDLNLPESRIARLRSILERRAVDREGTFGHAVRCEFSHQYLESRIGSGSPFRTGASYPNADVDFLAA
jgi:hypothetical protein